MTGPRPRVIVTLPGRGPEEVAPQAAEARADGGDVAEVRFDRWAPSDLRRAPELFPTPLPLLATYRSAAEGGHGSDVPRERSRILAALGALPFEYLDLELARDIPLAHEVAMALRSRPTTVRLLSAHLPPGTSPAVLHRTIVESAAPGAIVKLVLPANVGELLFQILPQLPPNGVGEFVVATTGRSGPLLRAWARRRGSPLVFVAPGSDRRQIPVEPAQIPVDRIAPFLRAPAEAPIFAVVGRSVGRSRSPELHHRWMARLGRVGLYVGLDFLDGREFVEAIPELQQGGFRGLNVTSPLKREALEVAERASAAADGAGCANVLSFTEDGIAAENTDVLAVLRRLGELKAVRPHGVERVTLIGTGGAARATLEACRTIGLRCEIVARDSVQAGELARQFGAETRRPGEDRPPADLLVHATTAGTESEPELAVPLEGLVGPGTHILDFVYAVHHRFLAERADQHRATYEDGTGLLVYQAAESFRIWWGEEVPAADLKELVGAGP